MNWSNLTRQSLLKCTQSATHSSKDALNFVRCVKHCAQSRVNITRISRTCTCSQLSRVSVKATDLTRACRTTRELARIWSTTKNLSSWTTKKHLQSNFLLKTTGLLILFTSSTRKNSLHSAPGPSLATKTSFRFTTRPSRSLSTRTCWNQQRNYLT